MLHKLVQIDAAHWRCVGEGLEAMNNPCRQIFTPGDKVIITHCLEYPKLIGKQGTVTNTQETGYNFDMLWLLIDDEEYMFFSDEVMLADDSGPKKD